MMTLIGGPGGQYIAVTCGWSVALTPYPGVSPLTHSYTRRRKVACLLNALFVNTAIDSVNQATQRGKVEVAKQLF